MLSPSDTCKTNQRKYQREMKVAPPFIKHCLHCLHCFDCLHCLHYLHSGIYINVGLLTWWHCWHCYIAACRIGFGAESGTDWVDNSGVGEKLSWSLYLWWCLTKLVHSRQGHPSSGESLGQGEDFPQQHNRSKQPAVIAGCYDFTLYFYCRSLKRSYFLLIKSAVH